MKHTISRQIYDYWDALRRGRRAPRRSELEPAELKELLPDIVILEQEDALTYRFRLAGTRVCSHFGAELTGRNLLDFWSRRERESIESLLFSVREDAAAAVLGFTASSEDGREALMEMVLLPLKRDDGALNRVFGSIVAIDPAEWLGTAALVHHRIRSLRLLWPDNAPRFTVNLDATSPVKDPPFDSKMPARRRSHLTVIEGGLRDS